MCIYAIISVFFFFSCCDLASLFSNGVSCIGVLLFSGNLDG